MTGHGSPPPLNQAYNPSRRVGTMKGPYEGPIQPYPVERLYAGGYVEQIHRDPDVESVAMAQDTAHFRKHGAEWPYSQRTETGEVPIKR